MKTKFLLFFGIIGIVWIDISCNKPGPKSHMDVTGIDTILISQRNSQGWLAPLSKDTMAYDSVVYSITFDQLTVFSNTGFSFISSAYADEEPLPYTKWEIDSIKIFSVFNSIKTEVTNTFSVSKYSGNNGKKVDNTDKGFISGLGFGDYYLRLFFSINQPVPQPGSYQFLFQFFDKKGRIFEKTSEPLVIAP